MLAILSAHSTMAISDDISNAIPIHDLDKIHTFFKTRFPDVPFDDFANGVYALDSIARENWEALEEFPPYELNIDNGESLWEANRKIYLSCFKDGPAIKHLYPRWDENLKTVITIPYKINHCRTQHKLSTLDYMSEEMNDLVA